MMILMDVTPSATAPADADPDQLDAPAPGELGSTVSVSPGQTEMLPKTGPDAGHVAAIGLVLVMLALVALVLARRTRRT